jgi:RNA polymerase-binding transcription factor DksA
MLGRMANYQTVYPTAPDDWQWHRRALLRLRESLLRERAEVAAFFRTPIEHGGEDSIDFANDEVARDTILAENGSHGKALAEINAALERINQGRYGICEDTGQPITAARLRAVPYTRYSLTAAMRREEANARHTS